MAGARLSSPQTRPAVDQANVGLEGVSETPRAISFCTHAIEQRGLFVVEDAQLDPRFASNPLVTGDLQIRFDAGAPLCLSDGAAVGTLCVIDRKPLKLSDQQRQVLDRLSRAAAQLRPVKSSRSWKTSASRWGSNAFGLGSASGWCPWSATNSIPMP